MSGICGEAFVVLSPFAEKKNVIYGRNSFRTTSGNSGEVQEILYFSASDNCDTIKCNYVEVEGAPTNSVILSKPGNNTWGAESGSNDKNVCIGITWTENEGSSEGCLVATDLVRLGLERGSSASDALDVITALNDKHGQENVKYCFVICDSSEVWLLNIIGKEWAAEKIDSNFRSIPQGLSISTKIDKCSESLKGKAQDMGLWDGAGDFNFSKTFSSESPFCWPGSEPASEGSFSVTNMFETLRSGAAEKTPLSSHVSTLTSSGISYHWFTGTPNALESVFKPFIFTAGARISPLTKILDGEAETLLHKLHSNRNWEAVGDLLKSLEATCVDEVNGFLNEHPGTPNQELDELMKDCVEAEVKFYR